MIHAVTFMAKGDIPMEKILPMMRFFIFQKPGMKWTKTLFVTESGLYPISFR